MAKDNAQGYFLWNGEVIHNIFNVDEVPNGGGSTMRRGITPSRRAMGRRRGQESDWTVTFDRDVLEGDQDFEWTKGLKGVFTAVSDEQTYNYEEAEVDMDPDPSTDDDGNRTERVTITATYREKF